MSIDLGNLVIRVVEEGGKEGASGGASELAKGMPAMGRGGSLGPWAIQMARRIGLETAKAVAKASGQGSGVSGALTTVRESVKGLGRSAGHDRKRVTRGVQRGDLARALNLRRGGVANNIVSGAGQARGAITEIASARSMAGFARAIKGASRLGAALGPVAIALGVFALGVVATIAIIKTSIAVAQETVERYKGLNATIAVASAQAQMTVLKSKMSAAAQLSGGSARYARSEARVSAKWEQIMVPLRQIATAIATVFMDNLSAILDVVGNIMRTISAVASSTSGFFTRALTNIQTIGIAGGFLHPAMGLLGQIAGLLLQVLNTLRGQKNSLASAVVMDLRSMGVVI